MHVPTLYPPTARDLAVWDSLSDTARLAIVQHAMAGAAEALAAQAEAMAKDIEEGSMLDRGGADALRLHATLIRGANAETMPCMGRA